MKYKIYTPSNRRDENYGEAIQEVNRLFKENITLGFFDEVNVNGKLSMHKKDTL